jgi:hypothetical protein
MRAMRQSPLHLNNNTNDAPNDNTDDAPYGERAILRNGEAGLR